MTNPSNTTRKLRQALQPVIGLSSCKQIHMFAQLSEHRLFVSVRKATTRSVWLRSGKQRRCSNYARVLDHLDSNHSSFLSFRNRAIFAYVDVDQNPLIQQRFHLFNLPSFILWVLGESRPNNFHDVLRSADWNVGKCIASRVHHGKRMLSWSFLNVATTRSRRSQCRLKPVPCKCWIAEDLLVRFPCF